MHTVSAPPLKRSAAGGVDTRGAVALWPPGKPWLTQPTCLCVTTCMQLPACLQERQVTAAREQAKFDMHAAARFQGRPHT